VFDDLVGHERERAAFSGAVERWRRGGGGLHHAYLFAGEEEYPSAAGHTETGLRRRPGHGPWRLALELGAAIVAGGEVESDAYRKALAGRHPDLTVIEREGDLIRIDQVERLIGELSLRPFVAGHRVWIIDEADTLHAAAANKLLKSLEEPPAHVYFLLVTAEADRVLPTIVSRCHTIEMGPASREALRQHVRESFGLSEITSATLADLAGGSVERAERLAADELSGRRAQLLEAALPACRGSLTARERFIDVVMASVAGMEQAVDEALQAELVRIAADVPDERDRKWRAERAKLRAKREATRAGRREVLRALDLVSGLLRDLWVVSVGGSEVLWNGDRAAELTGAVSAAPDVYERQLAVAGATGKDLHLNVDPALALRGMFCRFEEVCR
jgi:DNA polymerase-3 subunit delta'